MLANANPLEAAPASRSVREFVAVCARDSVPYGNLSCLAPLMRELNANKHFAMQFWSVVARQSAAGEAVVPSIVQAVTGHTPEEVRGAGPAYSALIDRLERVVAGQDVGPDELVDVDQPRNVLRGIGSHAELPPTVISSDTGEAVLPIRRTRDTRRRRLAPNRNLVSEASGAEELAQRDENMRLVLRPEPPVASLENAPAPPKTVLSRQFPAGGNGAPRVAVPLSSYAEVEPGRPVGARVAAAAVALGLIAAGAYLFRDGNTGALARLGSSVRAGYDSAVATWKGEPIAQTAPSVRPAVPAVDTGGTQAKTEVIPPLHSGAPSYSAVVPQKDRGAGPGLTGAQTMAVTAAHNQQRDQANSAGAIPVSSGLVQVPEGVMNAHLIASRVPVLPDAAREAHVTGIVRMQAAINKDGYVSRLHVLQGPNELRHAALQAVSAWRYRPYQVNGQPVDVVTNITVDFSSLE